MHFAKSFLFAIIGLGAMAFAAPVENAAAVEAALQDGCNGAYRGEHRACERGREQKHDGYAELRKGEREMARGNYGAGIRDERQGMYDIQRGQSRECRTGGRC